MGIGSEGGKGILGILNGIFGKLGKVIFIDKFGIFIFGKLRLGNSGKGGSLNGKAISGNVGGKEKGISIGIV